MEVDFVKLDQQKKTLKKINFSTEYLCRTQRYAWKLRPVFTKNTEQISDFFYKKKLALLGGKLQENDKSLLSLLPEPWQLKDIKKAAERILLAMQSKEKVTIFGDYDVDGTTSCAMLKQFFLDLGFLVDIYIPDRLIEGYGLNPVGLKNIIDKKSTLVVTVDNGISAFAACEFAKENNIDVIITDHHDIPPQLPNAFAIVNPKQQDCRFPYKMLAGVGVAFYLMIALRSLMRENNIPVSVNLRSYLDYVAIGTIADMAPLTGANHTLCQVGLAVLAEHLSAGKRVGLFHLLKNAGWKEGAKVDSADVGFKIGPRLNAAGRLGNALRSVEVLCANDFELAKESASFLHLENTQRQQYEKTFASEAIDQVLALKTIPDALVLHKEDWHPGIVGLVATRVLDKFYRPVLIFGTLDGKLKGSGRSTHSFNLFAVLNEVRHEFISFGGHFHAVGLTLAPEKLNWLQQYLADKAKELIAETDKTPLLYVDGFLPLSALNAQLLKQLEEFEPHGIENPRMRWFVGPSEVRHVKRIGKNPLDGHAKVLLHENSGEFWLTAFGMADIFEEFLATGLEIQLVVEAKLGFWNGRAFPELKIIDCAPVVTLEQA